MRVCPHCHQQIAVERLGVRLPPLKARIVDIVKAAGDLGVTTPELHADIYRDYPVKRSIATVRVHFWQINEMLAETDWVIISEGRGPHARWYLQRRRQGRRAA